METVHLCECGAPVDHDGESCDECLSVPGEPLFRRVASMNHPSARFYVYATPEAFDVFGWGSREEDRHVAIVVESATGLARLTVSVPHGNEIDHAETCPDLPSAIRAYTVWWAAGVRERRAYADALVACSLIAVLYGLVALDWWVPVVQAWCGVES